MIIYTIVFLFGTVIGSFLNVCIYRIPREMSIIFPSSRCTSCDSPIRFYDNIPIISYLMLLGRCRSCRARIPLRYPLVEFLNGLLYVLALQRFGDSSILSVLVLFTFLSSLVVITFIDIDFQIIPDSITLPGIPIALLFGSTILPNPFQGFGYFQSFEPLGFMSSILGLLSGGGIFLS